MHNSNVLIIEATLFANILINFRFSYIRWTNHWYDEEAAINPLQRLIRAKSDDKFYVFFYLTLSYLHLDGGGARAFAQLEAMEAMMHRLRWEEYPDDLDKEMLPCEHFDIMGGSDVGGQVIILLKNQS